MHILRPASHRLAALAAGAALALTAGLGGATAAAAAPAAATSVVAAPVKMASAPSVKFSATDVTTKATSGAISKSFTADRAGTIQVQVKTGWWSWSSISSQRLAKAGTTSIGVASFNRTSSETYRVVFTPTSGSTWTSSSFRVTFTR